MSILIFYDILLFLERRKRKLFYEISRPMLKDAEFTYSHVKGIFFSHRGGSI